MTSKRGGGRRAGAGQSPLPLLGLPVAAVRLGRVERAVNVALRRGQRDGHLDTDLDAGMAVTARALARALDAAEADGGAWAVATLAAGLRDTLARLRLDPTARGATEKDPMADFLASLSTMEAETDAGCGAVGDPTQS